MKGIIWYDTKLYGLKRFKKLVKDYESIGIKCIEYPDIINNRYAKFENGDIWNLVPAKESSKMYRCNISLIEKEISQEVIHDIIKHCTIALPYHAINYY